MEGIGRETWSQQRSNFHLLQDSKKKRPKVEAFLVGENDYNTWFRKTKPLVECNINETSLNESSTFEPLYTSLLFINQNIDIKDAYDKIKASERKSEVFGAKIMGGYENTAC